MLGYYLKPSNNREMNKPQNYNCISYFCLTVTGCLTDKRSQEWFYFVHRLTGFI